MSSETAETTTNVVPFPVQPQQQEMPLEVTGNEAVLGADEMQHFDHRTICRPRGTGC